MGTPFIIKGYDFNYIFALPCVSFLTTVVSNIITTNVHICFKDKEHDNDKSVTTKGDLTNMHACDNNTNKSHCGLVRLFY